MRRLRPRAGGVLVALLLSTAVAVLTNLVTDKPRPALIAGFAVLVAASLAHSEWQWRRERQRVLTAARTARSAVLTPLRLELPSTSVLARSPLLPLDAAYCPTPVWGRSAELRRLTDWCTGSHADRPVLIMCGPGGVGKTRLAAELGAQLPEPWSAGKLKPETPAVERILACPEPTLVVIDDAETVPGLAALVTGFATEPERIRVLLLARDADGLRGRMRGELPSESRWLLDGEPLRLGAIGEDGDRRRWFAAAVRAYAEQAAVPPPEVSERDPNPVGHDDEPMLVLHARALLAVRDRARHTLDPSSRTGLRELRRLGLADVAAELLTQEEDWWRESAEAPDSGVSGHTRAERAQTVLALSLRPASTVDAAATLLARVPRLADTPVGVRVAFAEWAWRRYPRTAGHRLDPRPHFVLEWLISQELADTALAEALLPDLPDDELPGVLATLTHAAATFPPATDIVVDRVRAHPEWLVPVALAALASGLHTPHFDRALAALATSDGIRCTLDDLNLLDDSPLERLTTSLHTVWVAGLRQLAAEHPDQHRSDFLSALVTLGNRLRQREQYELALAVDLEAVDILRELAARDAKRHKANLAGTISNLGVDLRALGRWAEALRTDLEAVALLRELVTQDPGHQTILSLALTRLGNDLHGLGRPLEALPALREAVALSRRDVEHGPDGDLDSLDPAVTSLGLVLRDLGHTEDAVAAFRESTAIERKLADRDPGRDRTGLASSLTNLANGLHELGQFEEALSAVQQAVAVLREAVARHPERHQLSLAVALDVLGATLRRLGEMNPASEAFAEAVAMRRVMAARIPGRYRADLALALQNYAVILLDAGQAEDADGVAQEAVAILRELAEQHSDRYRGLAQAVSTAGVIADRLGRSAESLAADEEAVALMRDLAARYPDRHLPDLADFLRNLSISRSRLGRSAAALAAEEESVRIWRERAATDPNRYRAEYERARMKLRDHYLRLGEDEKAMTFDVGDLPPR